MFLRNRPSISTLNLYEAMLYLYPRSFRTRFGSEMALIFRESHLLEFGDRNRMEHLRFWIGVLKDLAISLPTVWSEEFRHTGMESFCSRTDLLPVFVLVGAVLQVDGGMAAALTRGVHSTHHFDWPLFEANLMFSGVLALAVLGLVATVRRRRSETHLFKLC